MERDEAWKRVFDRLPVLETLARDGIFHVSADELKIHGGREPRLMAKVDTLAERPAVLAENGLAIFPVRNGHYALFPDPDQKAFFRFSDEDAPPLRPFRSKVDLNLYDTLPRGQQSSESQALDSAFISSMLDSFCGESDMRLTIRGRFFSGGFKFKLPTGDKTVEVNRVQIEVDAGYEGSEGVYLIEAKRGRRDDFHIRQLWYPWLHWATRTRKRVTPIFFTYSNGQYFLTEMAFGELFGDLRIIRNRAYCLEASPLAELDLRNLLETIVLGPEPEAVFPQANDLDKVVDLLQATGQSDLTKASIAELFDFEERQADYYGNAACYLGLLRKSEGNFLLTAKGLAFAELRARADRTKFLVTLLIGIPSFCDAVRLLVARDLRVEKIGNQELAEIILKHTGLAGSTPMRRASTVRAWLVWMMRNLHIKVG
jgi:hypothetical protein